MKKMKKMAAKMMTMTKIMWRMVMMIRKAKTEQRTDTSGRWWSVEKRESLLSIWTFWPDAANRFVDTNADAGLDRTCQSRTNLRAFRRRVSATVTAIAMASCPSSGGVLFRPGCELEPEVGPSLVRNVRIGKTYVSRTDSEDRGPPYALDQVCAEIRSDGSEKKKLETMWSEQTKWTDRAEEQLPKFEM